ncbi:Putative long-chain-fatty-acid--CoA ligase (Long-chain acyl-CoA synthetase) [Candidatus Pelagibacter ubique HTCC1002]|uniref:Putative long-chain-fatty-acid--CoA ligase (Long-chain acyl-CoA synthetase) n=1 Tax=Pelagibacter ubique (strain HTCC1002) TaxID=314261 RepID=Q1V1I0_PELU1|nr:AMP-binding protein [Candidatus Pelagibacter ubique]EAS84898.1 Putative long-chain-fatty-acid--CoA ligase (Long-chain acyl-CoA synthetase) [Candidatus Pelagibacter ubique HTCC1002]
MEINKINNLLELFYKQYLTQDKTSVFLQSLKEVEKKYSWEDVYSNVIKLSEEISRYIKKGDRCLLISENRPEWMISDLSIMLSEGITVPAYTTYVERDYEYIIDDCTPTVLIISNKTQYLKVKNIIPKKKFIKKIIFFDVIEEFDQELHVSINQIFANKNFNSLNFSELKIQRKDIACIIYTSGTQGNPKGVVLSHGGILNNCEGALGLLKEFVSKKPKFLTWLPLSHSYEHTVQFVQIVVGAQVFYAESIEKLIKNMENCSPEIMTAVPRFYQNLHQKINTNFSKATGIKKFLINQTIKLGNKKLNRVQFSLIESLINFVCDLLVRKKIKEQFGGNLKAFISGGGALDKEVGCFLNAIGLPTLQGYGLTETSPVVSCNSINEIRVETVGKPFRGNLVKIANDGEILVKGENVMLGYWNNEEETNKVLKNGWLSTGDIGEFDGEFLKITDRKKDIIITPGGDNISPIKIESDLNKSNYIEQSLVYGDNKPYLVCLIVLSSEYKNIKNEEIKIEIEKINKNLSKIEKIKKFFVIKNQFTIENNMMNPTLKLKRYKIIKTYQNELEKLFN